MVDMTLSVPGRMISSGERVVRLSEWFESRPVPGVEMTEAWFQTEKGATMTLCKDEVIEYYGPNEKQQKLIQYYERQLEKVKAAYGGDFRKEEYIRYAEENLEAVKNGREW